MAAYVHVAFAGFRLIQLAEEKRARESRGQNVYSTPARFSSCGTPYRPSHPAFTMRLAVPIAAACTLVLCLANLSSAEERPRWPRKPEELEVSLSPIWTLEDGPIVCKVALKNVSSVSLKYAISMFDRAAYCYPDGNWKRRKEPLGEFSICIGDPGPYERHLLPGETASELFYVHKLFLSAPAGGTPFRFGWRVYRIVERSGGDPLTRRSLELLFELKGTQTIDVLPATPKNVTSVLQGLEAELAEVAKRVEGKGDWIWSSDDPSAGFIETLDGCRHKEFVPLLFRAMNLLPASDYRRRLVATVYECSPSADDGFAALAGYLSSSQPAAAADVFDYWMWQDKAHEESRRRQEELKKALPKNREPQKVSAEELSRAWTQSEEDAWQTSKRHADTRLTKKQSDQLRAIRDVWVRALLYAHYPTRCPKDWTAALLKDVAQVGRPPEGLQAVIAKLDDDSFDVREQATAELIAVGVRARRQLEAALETSHSAEAGRRLKEVLDTLKKQALSPECRRVIAQLGNLKTAESRTILKLLAAGDADPGLAKAAKAALGRDTEASGAKP